MGDGTGLLGYAPDATDYMQQVAGTYPVRTGQPSILVVECEYCGRAYASPRYLTCEGCGAPLSAYGPAMFVRREMFDESSLKYLNQPGRNIPIVTKLLQGAALSAAVMLK